MIGYDRFAAVDVAAVVTFGAPFVRRSHFVSLRQKIKNRANLLNQLLRGVGSKEHLERLVTDAVDLQADAGRLSSKTDLPAAYLRLSIPGTTAIFDRLVTIHLAEASFEKPSTLVDARR